jgi:flavin-dependent dehydrogenase
MEHAEFYSAPVPCLQKAAWKDNVISGEGWALVGDAAGLADPITGEGIYFAFRSAEILSETIQKPGEYAAAIWRDMGTDLARASAMYRKFYRGQFLGADFLKRAVQITRKSRTMKKLVETFIEGHQPYIGLKKKLFFSVPSVAWDLVARRQ